MKRSPQSNLAQAIIKLALNMPPHIGRAKIVPSKDMVLLPKQAKWVNDPSPLKLGLKSRQVGWTWSTAFGLVLRIAATKARFDAFISSRDELQAKLFLQDCKAIADILHVVAEFTGIPIVSAEGHATFVLRFASGHCIYSMSSNPDAQAGKRGDRIIDEIALHKDPQQLCSIAFPGTQWGGRLEIFSTPRGGDNYFNTLINEILHGGNPKKFSFHKITLQDALDEGLLYKIQQKLPPEHPFQPMDETDFFNDRKNTCPDEETFLQEYMCLPADEKSAFLSYDLIASCEYPTPASFSLSSVSGGEGRGEEANLSSSQNLNPKSAPAESFPSSIFHFPYSVQKLSTLNTQLFLGVDIGRDNDLTVIWVLEKLGDVLYTRNVIALKNQPFDAQEKVLYELLELPQVKRCCIDQTGIGRQFTERAKQKFGYKVEGITFTSNTKEELAYPVRSAFESKTIRIPNDAQIRSDLRAIKKETTLSGNIRFTADRGKNGHADRFWALGLAVHAAKTLKKDYWILVA
jgi:phage FluMu gp28-like protein